MIKRLIFHPAIVWCVRLIVAAVLIYAALQKIWTPLEFARLVREYHLVPEQLLNLVAVTLPWLELVCGCCLITGLALMGTALLLSALNSVFVVAIIYRALMIMQTTGVNFFDLSFDCGCGFGVVYIPTKIVENLLLVAAGLLMFFSRLRPPSGSGEGKRMKQVLMLACALAVVSACAVNPVTLEKEFMIISEEKEISIGERSDPVIVQEYGLYDDPGLQGYVDEVGQKLVKVCSRKNIEYHFKLLDTDDANAFALPGGYIYLTRGIMALMNSEAEMAGVLSHEIGHVVGRDSANQISQQTWFQIVAIAGMAVSPSTRELAMAGNMLFNAVMLGYGREKEFLADSQGVEYMFRAGYDPLQMAQFLGTLGKIYQGPAGYAQYLTTHPFVNDRINRAEAQAKVLTAMDDAFARRAIGSADASSAPQSKSGRMIRSDEFISRLDGLAYGPRESIRRIKIYTVNEGDTLESLANDVVRGNQTVKEIAFMNGLDPASRLSAGQKLKLVF